MLRILYDDFDQKVKNIHDEMDLHHSYKKKACIYKTYIYIPMILYHASVSIFICLYFFFT